MSFKKMDVWKNFILHKIDAENFIAFKFKLTTR